MSLGGRRKGEGTVPGSTESMTILSRGMIPGGSCTVAGEAVPGVVCVVTACVVWEAMGWERRRRRGRRLLFIC